MSGGSLSEAEAEDRDLSSCCTDSFREASSNMFLSVDSLSPCRKRVMTALCWIVSPEVVGRLRDQRRLAIQVERIVTWVSPPPVVMATMRLNRASLSACERMRSVAPGTGETRLRGRSEVEERNALRVVMYP